MRSLVILCSVVASGEGNDPAWFLGVDLSAGKFTAAPPGGSFAVEAFIKGNFLSVFQEAWRWKEK